MLLAYSARNRSASVRIPWTESPKAKRVECRFPDPAANPYLGFAALLMAGIDGIRNKIDPGAASDKDLYDLPPEELAEIPTVCGSLREALTMPRGRPRLPAARRRLHQGPDRGLHRAEVARGLHDGAHAASGRIPDVLVTFSRRESVCEYGHLVGSKAAKKRKRLRSRRKIVGMMTGPPGAWSPRILLAALAALLGIGSPLTAQEPLEPPNGSNETLQISALENCAIAEPQRLDTLNGRSQQVRRIAARRERISAVSAWAQWGASPLQPSKTTRNFRLRERAENGFAGGVGGGTGTAVEQSLVDAALICKEFLSLKACDRVRTSVRPVRAARLAPLAEMVMRGSGPNL